MSLADALSAEARRLGADERRAGGTIEWVRGNMPIAALDGGTAEFRLPEPIAAAALRTPGTARSDRGPGWVAFAPSELDRIALDRATAWLASAWRHGGSGRAT